METNNNNDNSLYRYAPELYEIQIGNSDTPLKWRVGSRSFVPGVGAVTVSRIFLDTDGYNLNGVSQMLVMACPEGQPEYEYCFRMYPADFCSVTPNGLAELTRLGFRSDTDLE